MCNTSYKVQGSKFQRFTPREFTTAPPSVIGTFSPCSRKMFGFAMDIDAPGIPPRQKQYRLSFCPLPDALLHVIYFPLLQYSLGILLAAYTVAVPPFPESLFPVLGHRVHHFLRRSVPRGLALVGIFAVALAK